ncbi:hypothetical protein Pcinc_020237 [Petrolisthes cinctipes]|uniref:CCHC-type domain-containing protein n=1 Tax=Petrolisthes cinctipes TaxID=88211 RepID=A0AAE1KLM2_PETCI|nr:hypothetical protein Pcinc_020237 [Petrolisthes cinctipes]
MSVGGCVSLVSAMKPFDENTEHLNNFLERLDLYFEANDVPEEKRTPTLLSLVGPKRYSSLRDNLTPIKPSDKGYTELVEMLKAPEPMEMMERFRFYKRSQKPGESVVQYVDVLKHMTRFCNFGNFVDEAIRDRLVCGISDTNIQKKLINERTLTLDSAVVVAKAMEAEAIAMRQGMAGAKGIDKRGLRSTTREKTCFVCGEPGHIKQDCQHKSAVCERCGRGGHVVKMCRVPINITSRTIRNNKMKPGLTTYTQPQGDDTTDPNHKDQDGRNCEELAGRRTTLQPYNSRLRQYQQQPRGKVPQDYDYFLVLDFESTCDDMKRIDPQEIIEFPVLKLNATTYDVEATFHHFVRPTKHPTLSQYCTDLTSITQDEVNNGKVFEDVFADFDNWMKEEVGLDKRFLFITCGDWDLKTMLPNQCSVLNLQVPSYCKKWLNIKKTYVLMTGEYNKGMLAMINGLGLKHQGRHHRGLDDCHNIGNILRELAERGFKFLPTMNVE